MLFSYQDRYTQEFFIDKIGENAAPEEADAIAQRKEHARTKLELMIRYAQSHHCRRQQILSYFGDETEVRDCRCDVCAAGATTASAAAVEIPEQTVTLVRQLLSGIARCNGKFGIGAVAEVLAGTQNERTERWGLQQLTVFGLLKAHPIKRLVAMLHRLIESGLARQRDPDGMRFRPVVELTASGVTVMKGQAPPPASLLDLAPRAATTSAPRMERAQPKSDLDDDARKRFERLRSVRTQLAREKQLPAYVICHDQTLEQMAILAPADPAALEQIKGMGPFKIKTYGQQFLQALHPDSEA